MTSLERMRNLSLPSTTKIVMLVLDGLGGLPLTIGGPTELEAAATPNLDKLANEGTLGLSIPIRPGITPGSGPAHLSLFGYDPLIFDVGRGILEAAGIGIDVNLGDVAARANFCTLDSEGKIVDRRAGRIPTDETIPIISRLSQIQLPGVETIVEPIREYRFSVVMRGEGLHPDMGDTDPQSTQIPPLPVHARTKAAQHTADLFNDWIAKAREVLSKEPVANGILLRGFSTDPRLPQFPEIFKLRAVCVAVYPMYRGVSRLVGMEVHQFEGEQPQDQLKAAAEIWDQYDFFFIHIKKTDSMGEDGNFDGKVAVIEKLDAALPILLDLNPDVLGVTGDHSTPSTLRSHSWHPVPLALRAPATARPDQQTSFGERTCAHGGLGTFHTTDLMPLLMAHANRLAKYGA